MGTWPASLDRLLTVITGNDAGLSDEASVILRMLMERHCMTGDARWATEVDAFLTPSPALGAQADIATLVNLDWTARQQIAFVDHLLALIAQNPRHAWRLAYVLKQACLPGTDVKIAEYVAAHWRRAEDVTIHLLVPLWDSPLLAGLAPLLRQIANSAETEALRKAARDDLDWIARRAAAGIDPSPG